MQAGTRPNTAVLGGMRGAAANTSTLGYLRFSFLSRRLKKGGGPSTPMHSWPLKAPLNHSLYTVHAVTSFMS